jgi:5-methylcytosine-specific restriction protein A
LLGDITREGVTSAIAEFDRVGREAFLSTYGFGPARSYFLVVNGQEYDSKAICGAAHGFDRPREGALRPDEFSGGAAASARVLERLGFQVTRPTAARSGWAVEERILALDLYLRVGVAGRTHPDVIALSDELNRRRFHPDAETRENFRNPNGVALKLANFAALDPSYEGRGMQRHSVGDEETWDEYAGDADTLAAAVASIRAADSIDPQPVVTSNGVVPIARPIERRHVELYQMPARLDPQYAERREAQLVESFAAWLRRAGANVTAHHYDVVRPVLRSDLADETARCLWEAKADVSRSSVRMALGQLLDYLRFEPSDWVGGVLLPHAPSADLVHLIRSAERSVAWPTGHGSFHVDRHDPSGGSSDGR